MKNSKLFDHDLENFPLYVRTNSLVGSNERMAIEFHTAESTGRTWAGGFIIDFKSTPEYYIFWCNTGDFSNFNTNLPSGPDRTWKIALDRYSTSYADVRLVVHCNGMEVINRRISESSSRCPASKSSISKWWSKIAKKISFRHDDRASDFYSTFVQGNRLRSKSDSR